MLDSYGAPVRLGEPVQAALARTPTLRTRRELRAAAPGPDGNFVARAVGVAETSRARLERLLLGQDEPGLGPDSAGTVRSVVLVGDPGHARAAVPQLTALFGTAPSAGCAGLDGVALDEVLTWRLDGGGVALTIPAFRGRPTAPDLGVSASGDAAPAQLMALAGGWDTDRIEIGYRTRPCPATGTPVAGTRAGRSAEAAQER